MVLRIGQSVLFCLLLLATLMPARGELVLTNFSPANPIKVMAIGDSITDDCVTNGAWRRFLQPLLETNGYAFTFVGRQASSSSLATFTQTSHEGYCGAVIAAPGELNYPVHGYAGADVYLQKIVRAALTNTTPDVVLLLIGANAIGRGRDPRATVTNSLLNLLNLIYSNAPNANVVLAKITTLQDASLGYSAYALNVPLYNATLQKMVNQQRALGKNVFLADMFSTVDYNTMFNSDHLHPNASGLNAIATEWLTRMQTFILQPGRFTTLYINGGASWNYSDKGQDLGTNWAQPNFDDRGWSNGIARLGYGFTTATTVSYGPVSTNRYITTYFRRSFNVPGNAVVTNLNFRLLRVDGAVVWLNGREIFRANLPDGPITYTNLALAAMTNYIYYPTNIGVAGLPTGTNVVAVEIHQSSVTHATLGFDLELIGSGYLSPTLSIAPAGENFRLSWPATNNGGSFTLYSASNLTVGGWTPSTALTLTNEGQIVVTQAPAASAIFFRLQQP